MEISNFKGYRGSSVLKRAGVQIEWTPDMIAEYYKCSNDPIYFIENYMKVIHVDHGLVPLVLRDYQKEMINAIHENRFTIITTARQSGKSTSMIGYTLWYIIFNPYKTVALLANKGETARELLGRLQMAYTLLPKFLQQGVVEFQKGGFELENGSRVLADATSSDAIRGYSLSMLILDECAHIEGWDSFSTSVLPTVTSGQSTKIVQISTPNGLNHFYKTWKNALEGRSEYKPILVTWDKVPGRDQKWYNETLALLNFDMDKFNQEHCCEFLGSSGTLIAGWKLKELVHQTPIFMKDGLKKYHEPEKGKTYVITADVSEGKGLDYSAFNVIDVTQMPYVQVASFKSNILTPTEYGDIIYRVAKAYNNAQVLIEFESLGPQVADYLVMDLEYEHVLNSESKGSKGKQITFNAGKGVDRGIKMTITVKATGCSLLKLLIEQNQLIINDFETIEELSTFSRKNKSFEAEEGCHDDLVMSLVIFAWLTDQTFFRDLTDIFTLAKLRDKSEKEIEQEMIPFGFHDDGRDAYFDQKDESVIYKKSFTDSFKFENDL